MTSKRNRILSKMMLLAVLGLNLTLMDCGRAMAEADIPAIKGNIASVNGVGISQSYFFTALQLYSPERNSAGRVSPEPVGTTVLRRLIENTLIAQVAKQEGVFPSDAEIDAQYNEVVRIQEAKSVKPFVDQLRDLGLDSGYFKQDQILPHICEVNLAAKGITVSDQEVASYYKENLANQFTVHNRAHIKRMVFHTQDEAKAVAKDLESGKTFEEEYDRSVNRDPEAGDVPQWLSLDESDAQFANISQAVKTTAPGKTTQPLNFQGGWWLIKVVEKKSGEVFPMDQFLSTIRTTLRQQKAQEDPSRFSRYEALVNSAQRAADIQVSNPFYKSLVDQLKTPPAPDAPGPGPGPQGQGPLQAPRP